MRIAFIGGSGHHRLRNLMADETRKGEFEIAVAGDGHDAGEVPWLVESIGAKLFDNAIDMLDAFKPELVSIGPVYGLTGRYVIESLRREIPTISDKPIANTWDELKHIERLIAGTSRELVTEFHLRCDRSFSAARHAVQSGAIGEVVFASAQKSYRFGQRPSWYANRRLFTGLIPWVASHAIDAVRYVTGRRFKQVFGQQGNLSRPDFAGMEDHSVNVFLLDNNASAIVHADYLRPAKAPTHGDDRIRVAGTKGIVEVCDGRCMLITHDDAPRDITHDVPELNTAGELFDAAVHHSTKIFSTGESLELAAVLLHARDAADKQQVITFS